MSFINFVIMFQLAKNGLKPIQRQHCKWYNIILTSNRYSELRSRIVRHMSVNYSAIFPDFCNKYTDTDKNSIDQI